MHQLVLDRDIVVRDAVELQQHVLAADRAAGLVRGPVKLDTGFRIAANRVDLMKADGPDTVCSRRKLGTHVHCPPRQLRNALGLDHMGGDVAGFRGTQLGVQLAGDDTDLYLVLGSVGRQFRPSGHRHDQQGRCGQCQRYLAQDFQVGLLSRL